jgi:hypothetical protein
VLGFDVVMAAPVASERRVLVDVRDVSLLDDGRVDAVAVIEDPQHDPNEQRFSVVLAEHVPGAAGSDQYLFLIDRIDALDSEAGGPEAGTPES